MSIARQVAKRQKAEASYQRLIARPVDEHGEEIPVSKSSMLAIRISPEDRDAIAAMAVELGISQSALILRKVLGKLPDQLELRVERIERRIARLERKSYGITLSDEEIDAMTEGT